MYYTSFLTTFITRQECTTKIIRQNLHKIYCSYPDNLINYFLINGNVFICIIDTNVVLVKPWPRHLLSRHPILHPPDFPKIYLHHTQPIRSTFLLTGYKTSPTKTYSSLCSPWCPYMPLPYSNNTYLPHSSFSTGSLLLDYNPHALISSSLPHIISVLQASRKSCLYSISFSHLIFL